MLSIDRIISALDREPGVLATLVELGGSGFRRPGARMLIHPDGSHTGSISGGCLEKDVARTCVGLTVDGPQKVLYDTRADEIHPHGMYGTGCEGQVYLLLERLSPDSHATRTLNQIRLARQKGLPIVIATRHEGKELGTIATFDGELWSRSDLSPRVREAIDDAYQTETSFQLHIESTDGIEKVLIEYVAPRPNVLIVGTGDDASALAKHVFHLGWQPIICSEDPLKLARFEDIQTLTLNPGVSLPVGRHTATVFISHDFDLDARYLKDVLSKDGFYIGLLGPRRRTARLFSDLVRGGTMFDIERVHAPAGVDLGSDEPTAVSLSIASEMVAVYHGRSAGMLSVEKPAQIQTRLEIRTIKIHNELERNAL